VGALNNFPILHHLLIEMKNSILIIGAGAAGLVAARNLAKAGKK
jgi:heterodisulfide reductase subunit A-like polyferredoxin